MENRLPFLRKAEIFLEPLVQSPRVTILSILFHLNKSGYTIAGIILMKKALEALQAKDISLLERDILLYI
jgi:hypothetical protein